MSVTLDGATKFWIKLYVYSPHMLRKTPHFLFAITSLATKYCFIISMYKVQFLVAWLHFRVLLPFHQCRDCLKDCSD